MKSGIKILHWIIFLWVLVLILQFKLIVDYILLIIDYFGLLVSDFSSALVFVNFSFIDVALSVTLFILLLPVCLMFRKKLKARLNFSFAFFAILIFLFLFAPLITNENPEFTKNLSVTKLLSPFSSVKQIALINSEISNSSRSDRFKEEFENVIKPPFNDKIIFADKIIISDKVIYYQRNSVHELDKNRLVSEDGSPLVKNKLYILGTDEFGRDLFARLVYGTRISITVGLGAVTLSFIIGLFLGFLAGYRGGLIDIVLNRFTEVFLAFPIIYLIVLILALFGSSIFSVIIVLGVSGWMSLFKIVKTEVVSIKQKEFFATAELIGLNKLQLLKREIFPVVITPVLINLVFLFSNVILAEAALSYLGLGTGNSYPSWGSMISSGQEFISKAWWLVAFPGLTLLLTIFTVNSSGRFFGKKLNPTIKQ